MAFDKANPTNQEKIRNLGTVLRANFVAMQQGEDGTYAPWQVNFIKRNGSGASANDPATLDDNIILYSKESALSKAELWAKNEDGNLYQLTSGAPTIAATGQLMIPGGLFIKWGDHTFSGSGVSPVDYTTKGLTDFANNTYQVWISPKNAAAAPRSYYTDTYTVAGFNIVSIDAGTNQEYAWLAIGD